MTDVFDQLYACASVCVCASARICVYMCICVYACVQPRACRLQSAAGVLGEVEGQQEGPRALPPVAQTPISGAAYSSRAAETPPLICGASTAPKWRR